MADQATTEETKPVTRPPAYGVLGLLMRNREIAEQNARAMIEEGVRPSASITAQRAAPQWTGHLHESY